MERIEHLLETDVNRVNGQLSKKDDSSCQSTSLNEVGVNETKVAEESEGKRDQRADVFLDKEREVSSISITSGDSKNCLSAIAEMYSSSDEETCPENSAEPFRNESKVAEDADCKEMGINNFQSIGVNPIFAQEKGTSLEEENNNLNSNNSTDTARQITMMVEPELLKKPESGGETLIESDNDRQILMKAENDRHTLIESKSDGHTTIEPINDGNKQVEPERDRKMLLEPKIDGHIFLQTEGDRHTVMETESVGHTPTESTTDGSMPIKPESSECTLFRSENDGHILTQPESNGHTLKEEVRDMRTLKEQENNGCPLTESKSNGHMEDGHIVMIESGRCTVIEPPNDGNGHTLRMEGDGHTPKETDSEGNILIKSESDIDTLVEPLNDGYTLKNSKSDGHSPMETDNEGNILKKSDSDFRTLIEPINDWCTLKNSKSDGHSPVKTDNEGNILIKSDSDFHTLVEPLTDECTLKNSKSDGHSSVDTDNKGSILVKSESDVHTLVEPLNDGYTLKNSKSDGHLPMETDNEGNILIKSESGGHMLTEPPNDGNGNTLRKLKSDGRTFMETDNEGNILIKRESGGNVLANTECNKHTLPQLGNNGNTLTEPDGKMCTFKEQKTEEDLLVGPERHGDTPSCSDTDHPVYAMSSIDKELEIIGENENASQMGQHTECGSNDSSSSSGSSSDDESSSSESESSESSSEHDLEDIRKEIEKEEEHIHTGPLKTKSELLVKDLPEVPDLDITIDENVQLVELGTVFSIVESLVVVKALPQTPALDSDSVLFLESRSCLGLVFETFGPVQTPFYSVRFNLDRDISDKNVHVGDKVFYAPDMMEFSNFVFVAQLKNLKGSDASWEHDEEPPQEVIEYSDDEEESKARASKKKERMARKGPCAGDIKKESGNSDHQGPVRGGRKRTWQSRGRGQLSKQNQNQGVPTTNPPPLHHPAYRFPAPQQGDSLPPQASPLAVQRPAFPPQSQFMSHPTQDSPPFGMRHMVPPRGLPPRGPLDMMPQQAVGPFPGPHPGPIGNVPIPSSSPSRPLIGVQHVPGHWPVGPPLGFVPRYLTPGPRGTFSGFGLLQPSPPPPLHPPPPPPPPPNL